MSIRKRLWFAVSIATLLVRPLGGADELRRKVEAAIGRGRDALLPRLEDQLELVPIDYPMGRISLSLAALLKAGLASDHEAVGRTLERLAAMPLNQTYCVACCLFALDAYWQARYREGIHGDGPGAPRVSRIPPPGPVRKRMDDLVAWLVNGKGGGWNYGGRGEGDLSNTQFGALGLEVGLRNQIEIPEEVFVALAERLVRTHRSERGLESFQVTYRTPAWPGITAGVARNETYRVTPGGWKYTLETAGPPTPSMTAAGVSSLIIVRKALLRMGAFEGDLAVEVDRQIRSGLGWMGSHFATYLGDYYALYSFEKAGDLGGVHAIGAVDWYQEGARCLLKAQKADGSWGDTSDTALALLFLTRATQSPVAVGPPVVPTGKLGEGGTDEGASDLFYLPRLKGFISAGLVFDFLEETRDPAVIPVAEEAIRATPPHLSHEALAMVLRLWTGEDDAVSRFARSSAERLGGVAGAARSAYEALARSFSRVRQLEKKGEARGEEVRALLSTARGPILKRRLLDLVDRLGLVETFPGVIEGLTDSNAEVRRRAREILIQWTRKEFPPPEAEKLSPEEAALPWREWWQANGDVFIRLRSADVLLGDIDRARDLRGADQAVRALVQLGPKAVPRILERMEAGEFSIHLVRALEAITGKSAGLRAEDWRRVLGEGN